MSAIQTSSGKIEFKEIINGLAKLQRADLEGFAKQFSQLLKKKQFKEANQKERDLIDKIKNGGPANSFYKEFDPLRSKCLEGTMTEEENARYLEMIEVNEQWAVDRLRLAMELAEHWETSIEDVFNRLNIEPRKPVYA